MKPAQLRDMNPEELKQKEKSLKEELFNLQFQHGTNQLENNMRLKQTKRDIARVLTIIAGKEQRASARQLG